MKISREEMQSLKEVFGYYKGVNSLSGDQISTHTIGCSETYKTAFITWFLVNYEGVEDDKV